VFKLQDELLCDKGKYIEALRVDYQKVEELMAALDYNNFSKFAS